MVPPLLCSVRGRTCLHLRRDRFPLCPGSVPLTLFTFSFTRGEAPGRKFLWRHDLDHGQLRRPPASASGSAATQEGLSRGDGRHPNALPFPATEAWTGVHARGTPWRVRLPAYRHRRPLHPLLNIPGHRYHFVGADRCVRPNATMASPALDQYKPSAPSASPRYGTMMFRTHNAPSRATHDRRRLPRTS